MRLDTGMKFDTICHCNVFILHVDIGMSFSAG